MRPEVRALAERADAALDAVRDEIECERNFREGLRRGDTDLMARAQAALDTMVAKNKAAAGTGGAVVDPIDPEVGRRRKQLVVDSFGPHIV